MVEYPRQYCRVLRHPVFVAVQWIWAFTQMVLSNREADASAVTQRKDLIVTGILLPQNPRLPNHELAWQPPAWRIRLQRSGSKGGWQDACWFALIGLFNRHLRH